jgi:nitrate/TMAO reductase-like tetraheme cytochrome c subunit
MLMHRPRVAVIALLAGGGFFLPQMVPHARSTTRAQSLPLPTSVEDFFQGGSQPGPDTYEQILTSRNCAVCHGGTDPNIAIQQPWSGSMMSQSARDPLFYAGLAIAEQDATEVGDVCIRCHAPRAWLFGRSSPTDGSNINFSDRDGVNCHFCHRMIDPFYKEGVSPPIDRDILDNIEDLPVSLGGGTYILDPADRRRGTREDAQPPHGMVVSPFHLTADLCSTCHDVSNPAFDRQPDDTYALNAVEERHPTGHKYDQFPLERTYSEWSLSTYAESGVDAGGRFGGNQRVVRTCQDCHMPDTTSKACNDPKAPVRQDMAAHELSGGNTWVPQLVINLYPDEVEVDALLAGIERARSMLQRAASLDLRQSGDALEITVTNETGHKLPTGYPEGRRMWLNVRFFDGDGQLIEERGAYDTDAAELIPDTIVYEIKLGLDEEMARVTGLPAGPSFHFALANKVYKDNRIPPRGFADAPFREVQAAPVPRIYADGVHGNLSRFAIPPAAARAEVRLYYQTASKEFITFLRDANTTNAAGQVVYDQWEITGKSPPEEMSAGSLVIEPFAFGDFDDSGDVDLADFRLWGGCLTGPGRGPLPPHCRPGDMDQDDDVDLADYERFQRRLGG